jgi:cytochrome c oxidase subunit 1
MAVAGFLTHQVRASFRVVRAFYINRRWLLFPHHHPSRGNLSVFGLAHRRVQCHPQAVNFITTIVTMRAPGMTVFRMPIFVWNALVTSILILMAFPGVLAPLLFALGSDRVFGSHLFDGVGRAGL